VDRNSGQFKAPFNQIFNEARVFTPKDTAVSPQFVIGMRIMTGSFTKPMPVNAGDAYETVFSGVGTVRASFT
jgi:2-keto-4-pentenoate hydratase